MRWLAKLIRVPLKVDEFGGAYWISLGLVNVIGSAADAILGWIWTIVVKNVGANSLGRMMLCLEPQLSIADDTHWARHLLEVNGFVVSNAQEQKPGT